MDKKEARALANYIEKRSVDMRWWSTKSSPGVAKRARDCGTTCCCAGHYSTMRFKEFKKRTKNAKDPNMLLPEFVQEGLGLNEEEARNLFFPPERHDVTNFYISKAESEFQKTRLLEVLRGKRPLNDQWLAR